MEIIGSELEKYLQCLTRFGLILFYIGIRLIKLIKQARMPLEKDEGFFEISIKQSVSNTTKSNFPRLDNK